MDDVPCTYRISVKAVIKDGKGRILLLRETDGSWELPGGGLEHGEDSKKALEREIIEETGFSVDWIGDLPIAFWTIHQDVGSPTLKWFAFVVYEAQVSGTFKSDPANLEAHEARYFSLEDAKSIRLHENSSPYFQ